MALHTTTLSYLICLNLMFFTLVSATANYDLPCPPPTSPGDQPPAPTPPSTLPPTTPPTLTPPAPTTIPTPPSTLTPPAPTTMPTPPSTLTPPPAPIIMPTPPSTATPPTPSIVPPSTETPPTPCPPSTLTPPSPTPTPAGGDKCPIDILKLAACANVLTGVLGVVLGSPPKSQCCPLLSGLTDLDAAICLCTAIKANVLGINLDVPISLSVLLNFCNKAGDSSDFQCS